MIGDGEITEGFIGTEMTVVFGTGMIVSPISNCFARDTVFFCDLYCFYCLSVVFIFLSV